MHSLHVARYMIAVLFTRAIEVEVIEMSCIRSEIYLHHDIAVDTARLTHKDPFVIRTPCLPLPCSHSSGKPLTLPSSISWPR
jgi:hypothetical protein